MRAPVNADDVVDRIQDGDVLALSRAVTAVENETPRGLAILEAVASRSLPRPVFVGVTGPPGAGKSTLVANLLALWTGSGCRVGALMVDPSSPISGGSVLGDRVRIDRSVDRSAFIRSVATRGQVGGLTRTTAQVLSLFAAASFERVLVETVGGGQADVDIAALADVTLAAMPPGLGDDTQAVKAGTMEIADVIAVTKMDLPGAERALEQLESMVVTSRRPDRPVLGVSTGDAASLVALSEATLSRPDVRTPDSVCAHVARSLEWRLTHEISDVLHHEPGLSLMLAESVLDGTTTTRAAVVELLVRVQTAISGEGA